MFGLNSLYRRSEQACSRSISGDSILPTLLVSRSCVAWTTIELPSERRDIGGPLLARGRLIDQLPNLLETGVQFVQGMQNHGFCQHGLTEGALLDLAVMGDDKVLQQGLERQRKMFKPSHVPFEDLETQGHMTDELPASAVAQAPGRCEFLNLADVMEDCAGDQ